MRGEAEAIYNLAYLNLCNIHRLPRFYFIESRKEENLLRVLAK
ncbi:hypothetical protein [Helicobacter rodentium]|nr:hypothetical protein [Helicobacter rodentium]